MGRSGVPNVDAAPADLRVESHSSVRVADRDTYVVKKSHIEVIPSTTLEDPCPHP